MGNPNKQKGDRAERAVLAWCSERFPGSFKTRAGFNDDLGDVILEASGGRVGLQVKDVASPVWSAWFTQLRDQVATLRANSAPISVLGGVIVHKARGSSDPGTWRAVAPLADVVALIEAAYTAGFKDGQDNG